MAVKFDWLVVGAGFTGATFAERMASVGKKVLVLDGRDHLAGNAYDKHNAHGILVHQYGPHIFHTNSPHVRDYLSRFTAWRPYRHRVLGLVEERLVPIPFNLNSIAALFPPDRARSIEDRLTDEYGFGSRVPILKLRESPHHDLRYLAAYVYRNVYEQYTLKQWGLRPEELDPSVTARVPVAISRDDLFFQDAFQAMPAEGYASMFRRMLDHPNIEVVLDRPWAGTEAPALAEQVFYTGAVDALLDYRFGRLPYRSLRFEEWTLAEQRHQPAATINYPNEPHLTRITEQKFLTGQDAPVTTLIAEYPQPHETGLNIPYYPIPRAENSTLHGQYAQAAKREYPNLVFAGRLADYQYYNMDQACARALMLASKMVA